MNTGDSPCGRNLRRRGHDFLNQFFAKKEDVSGPRISASVPGSRIEGDDACTRSMCSGTPPAARRACARIVPAGTPRGDRSGFGSAGPVAFRRPSWHGPCAAPCPSGHPRRPRVAGDPHRVVRAFTPHEARGPHLAGLVDRLPRSGKKSTSGCSRQAASSRRGWVRAR